MQRRNRRAGPRHRPLAGRQKAIRICRAGLWKPRTKPGGFEGVGEAGIAWLQRVKRETGMYTSTEVATREHVATALKGGVDLLWIGARTAANPFAMQEIADALRGADVPVLVKNPVSPDLELWIGAIERIYNAGIRRIGAIHRGFTSIDKSLYRNHPMWAIPIELHRRLPPPADLLRPEPHRRQARTDRPAVAAGHGPRVRRTDRRSRTARPTAPGATRPSR